MNRILKTLTPMVLVLAPLAAFPQTMAGKHPGYLNALSDLRSARWFLTHQPGDSVVSGDEKIAVTEIDAAIGEINKAAIDDRSNLNDHPAVDVGEQGSRLLKAMAAINKARHDIEEEEDNREARDLRHRAVDHIQRAEDAASRAHSKWLQQSKH